MKRGAEFLAQQNRLPPPSYADAPALRFAAGAGRPGRASFSRTEGHELAMGQRPTAQDEKDLRQWPRTAPSPPPSATPAPPSPSRPPPSSAPTRASRKTSPRPSASSSPNTTPSAPSTRSPSSAWPRPSKASSTTRRLPCTSSASSGPSSPPQSGPAASTPKRSLRPATPPPAPPTAATTNMGLPSVSKARRSAPASSRPTWRCRPTPSSARPTAPSTPIRTSPAKTGKPTRPPPKPRSRRRPPSPRWEPSGADAPKRRGFERPPPPFPSRAASRRRTQRAVACRPSSSHAARSIRPVRRQIREPTRFNGFSIRHPHHHRLNPTAVDRFEHRLTGRALLRTPPSRRGAPANEHRYGRDGDPCGQSPRLTPIALRLLQDQPFLAFRQKRSRNLLGNPRDRLIDRLLGADARKTSSLRRLMRHRERVRARLDHPFDPTPIAFAFSTRRLQQRLKIAERRKIGLTRLLNRLQKRTHELTFQRIDMRAPVERRPLDPRDLLRETEVTTAYGRRSLVGRRPLRSAGALHSADGCHPPVPVAWARISGNHSVGISLNICGNSSVHHFRTRSLSKIDNPFPSAPNLPFIASAKLKPRSVTSDMQAKRGSDTSPAPLLTAR